jgi:hypothetical protein
VKRAAALATGIALAAAAIVSCATVPPQPRDPLDQGRLLAVNDPRVTVLLANMRTASEERRSLIATAQLSMDAPDLRFRRPQRLAARRPADLRIEVLGLFNQIAAVLVTDGSRYQLWDGSQQGDASSAVEQGEVSRDLLWSVARVDLSPAEAVALLLGVPFPTGVLSPVAAAETQAGGVVIVLGSDPEAGDHVVEFDREGRLTHATSRDAKGRLLWQAGFADYRELGSQLFAHEVSIDFPRFGARAELRFGSAELNPELSSDVFALHLGENAAR